MSGGRGRHPAREPIDCAVVPILDARDVSKLFGPHRVLDSVSLSIDGRERIGLVGANGCGKSTLGRLLAGLDTPDGGLIAVQRGARITYLSQTPDLDPARSALDETLAGLAEWSRAKAAYDRASRDISGGTAAATRALEIAQADLEHAGGWDLRHRAERMLEQLGVRDGEARVGSLSGGERRRVAIARALVGDPDLAVLDEPTNHLDIAAIEWLERYLADELRGAVLLITHDRALLDAVADRTCEIEFGRLRSYDGGWEDYLEAKAERLAFEERVEANRRNFLRRELEWLRRQPKARTTKSRSRIDRAEAAMAATPAARKGPVDLSIETARSGKRVLELAGLTIEVGGRTLVDRLDLTVVAGERLGILGPNGCGKTTLLRTIRGERPPTAGAVLLSATAALGYLSQERDDLDPEKSVLDNVTDESGSVALGGRRLDARSYLARFGLDGLQLRQPVGSLSGGERTRVALAKLLQRTTNLLILDEPTNDLDVATLAALEELLVEFEGTALVVTHDRRFLDRIATGVLVFEGNGRVVRHAGGYREWKERKDAAEAASRDSVPARPTPPSATPPRPKRSALSYREQKELERILDDIDAAERRVAELEAVLADPAIYRSGGAEVTRTLGDLETAKAEATRLTARWEDLASRAEDGAAG